jgi:hypothetical protein
VTRQSIENRLSFDSCHFFFRSNGHFLLRQKWCITIWIEMVVACTPLPSCLFYLTCTEDSLFAFYFQSLLGHFQSFRIKENGGWQLGIKGEFSSSADRQEVKLGFFLTSLLALFWELKKQKML